jgi:hypothetical protein
MVAGQLVHEKMKSQIAENMKDHGPETGNQADPHTIQGPFADNGKGCLGVCIRHMQSLRLREGFRPDLFSWSACPIPGALKLPRGPRTIKPLLHKNMVFWQKVRQRLDERCLARSDSQTARNGASRPLYSRYLDKNKFALPDFLVTHPDC